MEKVMRQITNLFALWTVIGTAWAWFVPEHFGLLLLVVFLLHAAGFLLGYLIAKVFRLPVIDRRTICIEVGMQNSGLGSSLAKTEQFQAQFATPVEAALAPVPCAISAVYHCIIGSLLAAYWRRSEQGSSSAPEV